MQKDRIRPILVPTDFSDKARDAAAFARDLAERTSADVHLLHVHATYQNHPFQRVLNALRESGQSVSIEGHVQNLLEEARMSLSGVAVLAAYRDGEDVTGTVLSYAREIGADLIVVGRSSHHTLPNFTAGNLGVRLAGMGEYAVAVVPEGRGGRILNVAVPVDFSENARAAVRSARDLSKLYGARLSLVYVVERKVIPVFQDTGLFAIEVLEPDPEISSRAREALVQFFGNTTGPDVDVHFEVRDGDADSQLLDFATAAGVDLMVMPPFGHERSRRTGLGRTTERMLRRAPCPVLVHTSESGG
jgi:nucleotide-binding universal stress UspA family protein